MAIVMFFNPMKSWLIPMVNQDSLQRRHGKKIDIYASRKQEKKIKRDCPFINHWFVVREKRMNGNQTLCHRKKNGHTPSMHTHTVRVVGCFTSDVKQAHTYVESRLCSKVSM